MSSLFTKTINLIAIICVFSIAWYAFISPGTIKQILFPPAPCSEPIRYSLGSIDPRFGLSTSTLLEYLEKSSNLWSKAVSSTLFVYDPKGDLMINLIYDERQSSTDKLKELGYNISNDRASYDALKVKHDELTLLLKKRKSEIDTRTSTLNARNTAYTQEVTSWNEKGGATPEVYKRLNKEQADLQSESDKLQHLIDTYNEKIKEMNSVVSVINRIADSLNIKADQANEISDGIEKEFQEGEYVVDTTGARINIYEFDSKERLLRLLAHEFGHALGLEHVDDAKAVMYYLNQEKETRLTQTDITAINTMCQSK
jgi:uncharacterized phage infection (PIP) family protein YhgE